LFAPQRGSAAIRNVLPQWELYLWYGGLTAGGILALVGLFLAIPTGYYVERIGLALLVGLTLAYDVAVLTTAPQSLAFGVVVVVAFAGACVARLVRIQAIIGRR